MNNLTNDYIKEVVQQLDNLIKSKLIEKGYSVDDLEETKKQLDKDNKCVVTHTFYKNFDVKKPNIAVIAVADIIEKRNVNGWYKTMKSFTYEDIIKSFENYKNKTI